MDATALLACVLLIFASTLIRSTKSVLFMCASLTLNRAGTQLRRDIKHLQQLVFYDGEAVPQG